MRRAKINARTAVEPSAAFLLGEKNSIECLFVCTIKYMEVVFDSAKDAKNREKHGISLARAEDFDFLAANVFVDDSIDYGEVRYGALGFLDAKLYVLVFTQATENAIRAISLRKAKKAERKRYAED